MLFTQTFNVWLRDGRGTIRLGTIDEASETCAGYFVHTDIGLTFVAREKLNLYWGFTEKFEVNADPSVKRLAAFWPQISKYPKIQDSLAAMPTDDLLELRESAILYMTRLPPEGSDIRNIIASQPGGLNAWREKRIKSATMRVDNELARRGITTVNINDSELG